MRATYTQLHIHCVWATWDRLPLITSEIREELYGAIPQACEEMKCTAVAIGGIEDHVHLLVGISTVVSVAQLMKQVKGSSSHLVTHRLKPGHFFKWQGAYGAFTVSHCEFDRVANYIRNQPVHHHCHSTVPTLELPPLSQHSPSISP